MNSSIKVDDTGKEMTQACDCLRILELAEACSLQAEVMAMFIRKMQRNPQEDAYKLMLEAAQEWDVC